MHVHYCCCSLYLLFASFTYCHFLDRKQYVSYKQLINTRHIREMCTRRAIGSMFESFAKCRMDDEDDYNNKENGNQRPTI